MTLLHKFEECEDEWEGEWEEWEMQEYEAWEAREWKEELSDAQANIHVRFPQSPALLSMAVSPVPKEGEERWEDDEMEESSVRVFGVRGVFESRKGLVPEVECTANEMEVESPFGAGGDGGTPDSVIVHSNCSVTIADEGEEEGEESLPVCRLFATPASEALASQPISATFSVIDATSADPVRRLSLAR